MLLRASAVRMVAVAAIVTIVAGAEKQAIRPRRMPVFFEHPRNGKETKDF